MSALLVWVKSSLSHMNGNCVEVASPECAEAGTAPGTVLIRDSTDCDGTVLAVTGTAWTAFLGAVRGGAA